MGVCFSFMVAIAILDYIIMLPWSIHKFWGFKFKTPVSSQIMSDEILSNEPTHTVLKPETLALYESIKEEMIEQYGNEVHDIPGETGFDICWVREKDGQHAHVKIFITSESKVMRIEFTKNLGEEIAKPTELKRLTGSQSAEGSHPTFVDVRVPGIPVLMMISEPDLPFIYGKLAVKDCEQFSPDNCMQYAMGLLEELMQA